MTRPDPVNEEIVLDPKQYIVSKTDRKGVIEYGNEYFVEISGYKESELIGTPHNLIRHPDMPKVAFKMMWERILKGENFIAIVKNLAKDGRYYQVVTEFESKRDPISNEIVSFTAFRKAAPKSAVNTIEPIYAKLIEIEEENGVEASEKFLRGYLENNNTTYDDFINKTVGNSGMFKVFFALMKKLFG